MKEKNYTNNKIQTLLETWNNYIKEEVSFDYEWQDISDTYSSFGFIKARSNKEHPYTIDLMKEDGTIYYAVYPISINTEDNEGESDAKGTIILRTKQGIENSSLIIDVKRGE